MSATPTVTRVRYRGENLGVVISVLSETGGFESRFQVYKVSAASGHTVLLHSEAWIDERRAHRKLEQWSATGIIGE